MLKDKITEQRIRLLHPKLVDETLAIHQEIDKRLEGHAICRVAYTLRTFEEQNVLFAQGRTKLFDSKGKRLGIVTKARGGQSYHNYRLATDIVLLVDRDKNGTHESASWETAVDFDKDGRADWMEVVDVYKSYGWEWGGDWKFKDRPHFQKTFGLSIQECLRRHNQKDFISGTNIIMI